MTLLPASSPEVMWVTDPEPGADGSHPLVDLAGRPAPWFTAWATTHIHRGLHVGATEDGWALTRPERSLMILGPPRDTGKTTAVLLPLVTSAYAPVVAAFTKDDLFAATALVRALQGRRHFAPDSTEPTPEGCRQLRWLPVLAAADWDTAVTTAEVMIGTTDRTLGSQSKLRDGGFWPIQAGSILAPLLHAAALGKRTMRQVMGWVMLRQLGEAVHILEEQLDEQRAGGRESAGTQAAFDLLQGADRTAPAELSGYWGACNAALSSYRREAALAITDRPNFSPDGFGGLHPRRRGAGV